MARRPPETRNVATPDDKSVLGIQLRRVRAVRRRVNASPPIGHGVQGRRARLRGPDPARFLPSAACLSAEINQCVRPAWMYYLLFWQPRLSTKVLGVLARGVLGLLTRTFDFCTGMSSGTGESAPEPMPPPITEDGRRLCRNQPVRRVLSAMTRPSWLGRAVGGRRRHAVEQASRQTNAP